MEMTPQRANGQYNTHLARIVVVVVLITMIAAVAIDKSNARGSASCSR